VIKDIQLETFHPIYPKDLYEKEARVSSVSRWYISTFQNSGYWGEEELYCSTYTRWC